jgi:hypothetical protein
MTYHDPRTPNPSDQPSFHWPPMPASPPLPEPPAPKKKHTARNVAFAAIGLFILIATIIGIALGAQSGTPRTSTATGYSGEDQQRQLDETPAAEPTTEPPTTGRALTAADMTLTLKTTEKQCFGSAGCNLTVEVRAKRKPGVPEPNPDETWQVTYQITGDEAGPIIGSFEITDGKYDINEENLSTRSSKTKVTIKVTDVEKVGI